jgi:hypothetical protein
VARKIIENSEIKEMTQDGTNMRIGAPERIFKFVAMPRRKLGISEDEFHQWWSGTLAPSIVPFLKRYNIIKYTQVDPSDARCAISLQ